jgi:hypothetical protein
MLDLLPPAPPTHPGVVVREVEAYGPAEVLAHFAAHLLPGLPLRQLCQEPGRLTVEWDQLPGEPMVDIAALSRRYPALLLVEVAEERTLFWGPVTDFGRAPDAGPQRRNAQPDAPHPGGDQQVDSQAVGEGSAHLQQLPRRARCGSCAVMPFTAHDQPRRLQLPCTTEPRGNSYHA